MFTHHAPLRPAAGIPGLPLLVDRRPGGDLVLSWGASCAPTNSDHLIDEGSLDTINSHTPIACSTGGAMAQSFTPSPENSYYIVVPRNSGLPATGDHSDLPLRSIDGFRLAPVRLSRWFEHLPR
jgi:hypothetical protein